MLVMGERREDRMFCVAKGREAMATSRTWVRLWW
jgi:hypothetical protein